MIKFIKQFFCKHEYVLNRWHISHGPSAMDPSEIEAEYICLKCEKISYRHCDISHIQEYQKICNQYERKIK